MACSNKSLVFLVAALLMAALVAAAPATATATAGSGGGFRLEANGQFCGRVRACKEDLCSASCAVRGIAGVGQCDVVGGEPTCCCVVPTEPSGAGVVH